MSVVALPTNPQPDRAAELRVAVREAFAEYHLLHSPGCVHQLVPPNDQLAERQIISAMLCSGALCAPLVASDFFCPLHAGIVQALAVLRGAGKPVPVAAVARGLEVLGFTGDIAGELAALSSEPYVVDLTDCLGRVRDASRRRRFLRWLRQLESSVATGLVSIDDAIAQCRRVRGGQ